ncbi:hypothetical protein KJ877_09730 [bacterium]|nr:hypothetical protein [bacterium]MBU1990045.1 hypothetical protein [bacterium]
MYIKRYTIATLFFILLVGWYVYAYITQDAMSIDFFGIPLPSLNIAVWVIVPIVLLYIASVMHMAFYSILGNFKLRKFEKDYNKFVDSIIDAYLGKEDRVSSYKTDRYKLLGSLIDNTILLPNNVSKIDTSDEKINNVLKLIEDIKNGEVVDLKKYSLASTNMLVIQNERNRYKKGDINAEHILTHSNKYDKSLCSEAYIDFVKTSPLYAIEKYKAFLTKQALFEILARVNSSENTLEISNQALISLIKTLELGSNDYIEISKILSTSMIPEQRMKLFETLSESKEEVMDAYLYTLFDLEMFDPIDEILLDSQPDEYLNFKAYRALKECNKHFNINLFI